MLDRSISSLVALSLASLVWLYMRSRDQEMLDNVSVPVQISVASGQAEQYELEINGPTQVVASFTGPPSRIHELRSVIQRAELHVDVTVTVPAERLEDNRYLETVRVESSDIHAPPGVTPVVVEGRNRIPVTLHRLVERKLPVRFESLGDVRVGQVVIEPAMVLVRGPQEVVDRIRNIPTQPYTPTAPSEPISSQENVTARAVPLVQELDGRRVRTTPEVVNVRLTLQPRQKAYELTDVPIQFLCPANFPLRPLFRDERAGKITLRVIGPPGEEPPPVFAFIDLSGRKWEAGLYEETLKLHLPKDFQVAQDPPRLVAFQLVPADAVNKASLGP